MIKLVEGINIKECCENENPKIVLNMLKKIFNFNGKGTGLKILTPIQMLQRLPTALAQVKASKTSENV